MNKIIVAIVIILILIIGAVGIYIGIKRGKFGAINNTYNNPGSSSRVLGNRYFNIKYKTNPSTIGNKPAFIPRITRLRIVKCTRPSDARSAIFEANPGDGVEVEYGMEVEDTIYTCRAGSKTKVDNTDILVFDPAGSQPMGTLKLWMVFVNNAPTYTISDFPPSGEVVLLGFVWPRSYVSLKDDTLDLKVNTRFLLPDNRLQTLLTTRPDSEALKNGWHPGYVIAKVPSHMDISNYPDLTPI
jgi:hypothetical protein